MMSSTFGIYRGLLLVAIIPVILVAAFVSLPCLLLHKLFQPLPPPTRMNIRENSVQFQWGQSLFFSFLFFPPPFLRQQNRTKGEERERQGALLCFGWDESMLN